MTGFGADGSKEEQMLDFEQVRGVFESNPFVTAVLKHIEVKTELGNELVARLSNIYIIKKNVIYERRMAIFCI